MHSGYVPRNEPLEFVFSLADVDRVLHRLNIAYMYVPGLWYGASSALLIPRRRGIHVSGDQRRVARTSSKCVATVCNLEFRTTRNVAWGLQVSSESSPAAH